MLFYVVLFSFISLIDGKFLFTPGEYRVKRKIINTPDAPAPVAPFNQAVQINYMLFLTGQIGLDPRTGQMVSGDVRNQTRQVLRNLEAVLTAGGSSVQQLAHCLIFLTNIEDYENVNEIYSQWFKSPEFYPARSSMEVKRLPFNATVAIECQAFTTKEIFN